MRDKIAAHGGLIFVACFGIGIASFAVGCATAMSGHSTIGAAGIVVAILTALVGFWAFIVFGLAERD